ncbi:MAG TPA: hypothetical protein VHO69_07570, partial [Phototrophicaceae bacterium]|nr:hypothetical protein [Phototrophicaceae bacterium]
MLFNMIHPIRRKDLFRLGLVLVLAAAARFYHLGTSEYHYDHAVLSQMAQQMVETRTLATLGMITSVGVPNTPTSVYVVALAYVFTADPLLVNAFLIALNVAGVGLLWLLAHRYFRPGVGLAAGLLYALNPWAIFYSRGIWAQDFLTPFMLAGAVSAANGCAGKTATSPSLATTSRRQSACRYSSGSQM